MCGRFTASFEFREIKIRWNLQGDLPLFQPRYNIAPSQDHPVILRGETGNAVRLMHWGLIPSWAKDMTIGNRMINARAETLSEKPSFKRLVDKRRCLIPADGFYEWRKEGKRKQPVWIHLKNREPFAFAGLWEVWKKPDDKILESFTIITCPPNDLLKPIHDRMPAILKPEHEGAWLDIGAVKFNSAQELLKPFPSELMDAHDVSPLTRRPTTGRNVSNLSKDKNR